MFIGVPIGGIAIIMICIWRLGPEQFPDPGDIGDAVAIAKETVVPDAMLALGQDVDQEPANKLICFQRHGGVPTGAFDTVILDAESDMIGIGPD